MRTSFAPLKGNRTGFYFVWHFYLQLNDILGRIDYYGWENIPKENCIVVANHVSFYDPPAMVAYFLKDISAVARSTLSKNKLMDAYFESMNAILINRDKGGDLGAIKESLRRIKAGGNLLIFPEGTRSPDGNIQEGKAGVSAIALRANVKILPVRSFGFFDIMPKTGRINAGTHISLVAGKAVDIKDLDPSKADPNRLQTIADKIMQHISDIKEPWQYQV